MTRRLLLAGALLLACPGSARAAEAPTTTVPLLDLKSGHIAVDVKINGEGPFRLVLDTGSPLTFISGRAAEECGFLAGGAAQKPAFFGMRGQAVAKTIDIGGVQVKDLGIMILDHPVLQVLNEIEGPLDGIVGYSFFARFRTTLDYAAKQVTFQPVDYQPEDVLRGLMARMMAGNPSRSIVAPAGLWGLSLEKPDGAPGLRVRQVYARSAAAAAGLKAGDRITTIDGRWTDSALDCADAAATVKPGQTTVLKVVRAGRELEVRLKPRLGL